MAKIGTGAGTWYATANDRGPHLSPAGYWYIFVSRPLFQFILARWYFRLFAIWARFLWQTSTYQETIAASLIGRWAGRPAQEVFAAARGGDGWSGQLAALGKVPKAMEGEIQALLAAPEPKAGPGRR